MIKISYDIFVHTENKGHGGARNRAIKEATGDVFFFLDADDLFFESHIYLSLVFLQVSGLPWSQTIIATSDPIHQTWISSLSNTLLLTKALTRPVIDLLEEFPDLGQYGGEDAIFYMGLTQYFPDKVYIFHPTVQYCRYPGNGFDVQYAKFSRPYGEQVPDEEKEETPRDKEIGKAHQAAYYSYFKKLSEKSERLEKPSKKPIKKTKNQKDEL